MNDAETWEGGLSTCRQMAFLYEAIERVVKLFQHAFEARFERDTKPFFMQAPRCLPSPQRWMQSTRCRALPDHGPENFGCRLGCFAPAGQLFLFTTTGCVCILYPMELLFVVILTHLQTNTVIAVDIAQILE